MSGASFMSDGTGAPGPYSQTPYKLVTSDITSVTNPPNTYQIKGVGINASGNRPSKADCLATTWNSAGAVLETSNFGTAETFGEYRQAQIYDLGAPLTHVYFSVNHTERVNWHAEIYGSNDPDTAFIELLDQKSFLDRDNPDGWLDSGSTPYRYIMFMGNFVGDDVTNDPQGLVIKNYGIKSTFTPGITLAFPDPNPDLQYFKAGDVVQGGAKYSDGFDLPVSSSGGGGGLETVFSNVPYENSIHALWNGPDTLTWSIPSGITGSKLTIDYTAYGGDFNVYVNDVFYKKYVYQGGTPDKMEIDIPDEGIKSIRWTWTIDYFAFHKAYVDGSILVDGVPVQVVSTNVPANTMTVDGGEWSDGTSAPGTDQSELWSAQIDDPGNITNGRFWALFNADEQNGLTIPFENNNNSKFYWNLSTPRSGAWTFLSRQGGADDKTGNYVAGIRLLDENNVVLAETSDGAIGTNVKTEFELTANNVAKVEWYYNEPTYTGGLINYWVKLNGVFFKDPDGETHVEYQTKGGQGDIVSVNTDDNTILLTETGDRDNRWIAENKAGTDFYVAGPQVIDDPLLTADVELESSLFATTPDNTDTLKNIVWELNGAEQNAGTSNPYKPSGLALNTEYTVRVKHQGNSLPDSAWSTSTTFTTGATRNLYTYYKERVDTLVARVEALENPGY